MICIAIQFLQLCIAIFLYIELKRLCRVVSIYRRTLTRIAEADRMRFGTEAYYITAERALDEAEKILSKKP